jgi:hypothetical protein
MRGVTIKLGLNLSEAKRRKDQEIEKRGERGGERERKMSVKRCRCLGLSLFLILCGFLVQVTAFTPSSSRRMPRKSVGKESRTPFLFGRSTKRSMVLDISDSVIEKVTTTFVLDQILDESLRVSARKPIMYQFDPSSKAVCTMYHAPFPCVLTVFSNNRMKLIILYISRFALSPNARFGNIGKEPYFPRLGGREFGT